MIEFENFTLNNGLKVIFHKDESTPIAAFNLLYNVGAKDEHPDKTGFAHLFEHLMFGGSRNIPDYDTIIQQVGASENAFTSNDITNYYLTIPQENIETAFWLESDRMLELDFSQKSLDVQKSVVIEEFNEHYWNQPYGDMWLLLRPLAYKVHPYQWATIGKEISHIEKANLDDVKEFFFKHYAPNNAVLCVAGNFDFEYIKNLAEKWFGNIPKRNILTRALPQEPEQTEARTLTVHRKVPFDAIYKTFHICGRVEREFYTLDLISDILANGRSSRLYQNLLKKKKLFSDIDAYLCDEIENGLFVISGNLMDGAKMQDAENAINEEISRLQTEFISEYELEKVKNKAESTLTFSDMKPLSRAMNLCFHTLLGDTNQVNSEILFYRNVSMQNVQETAKNVFRKENSSTLYYLREK